MHKNKSGQPGWGPGLAATLLLAFATVASGAEGALLELLAALRDNGTIDTAVYEQVRKAALAEQRASASKRAEGPRAETTYIADNLVQREPGRSKRTATKAPPVRVGGRIQTDVAAYSEKGGRHNDGTELRRARLFARGRLTDNWAYKLQYDFTATGIDGIQDAYIDYKGFKKTSIRLGHFKEPFSLQNMTSSKNVSFLERGLPHVFAPGRNIGLQARTGGDNWSLAGGIFGQGRNGATGDNDEGFGFGARGTYAPLYQNDHILHVGVSLAQRWTGSDDGIRFRERPESHVTDTRIVDTGTIDADSYLRLAFESALILGPASVQGEYYRTRIDRDVPGNEALDFSGFYVEGGWFLTGESRNYSGSKGAYGRVKPMSIVGRGGLGAWQVAMRYSSLDLSDADIDGGSARSLTLGLNWFATPSLRFSANYVDILDVDGGTRAGDEPDLLQIRAQVEF